MNNSEHPGEGSAREDNTGEQPSEGPAREGEDERGQEQNRATGQDAARRSAASAASRSRSAQRRPRRRRRRSRVRRTVGTQTDGASRLLEDLNRLNTGPGPQQTLPLNTEVQQLRAAGNLVELIQLMIVTQGVMESVQQLQEEIRRRMMENIVRLQAFEQLGGFLQRLDSGPQPVTPEVLRNIVPTEATEGNDRVCAICLEQIRAGQLIRTLPCAHSFHSGCAERWLTQRGICAVCRRRVDQGPPAGPNNSNQEINSGTTQELLRSNQNPTPIPAPVVGPLNGAPSTATPAAAAEAELFTQFISQIFGPDVNARVIDITPRRTPAPGNGQNTQSSENSSQGNREEDNGGPNPNPNPPRPP